MKTAAFVFAFAGLAFGQAPVVVPVGTVPVQISINWPPLRLVNEKYGPLPKWAIFGEIIGCDKGTSGVTFGEGDVIAALRTAPDPVTGNYVGGMQAFSRQDAFSLVANSQSASTKNKIIGWMRAGSRSVVDSKAAGLIGSGNKVGVGIVLGAGFISIILPDLDGVLNLKQVIEYNTDGLQGTMAIPAGRCSPPASLLFAVPGRSPAQVPNQPTVFTINVPANQ